jgi:hypothetical protein
MGLAASAAALGTAACSGSVVVDDEPGAGGAGGGTTSSGSITSSGQAGTSNASTTAVVTSTGTGASWCDVMVPSGQELVYACMTTPPPGEVCPPAESPLVLADINPALQDLGCGGSEVHGVVCGPEPGGTGCCYMAQVTILQCGGRPFLVNGAQRIADLAARSDWRASLSPDVAGLDADDRVELAGLWARDALDEHASVASFARFVLELLAVGAPSDLVREAQRAMGDEVLHAELCFGLASAYAGAALGPFGLPMHGALAARTTLAEVASAVVKEGCVGETLAAFGAMAARDTATDPAVRAALEEIARDEAAHAALAFRFLGWALAQGDAGVRGAVEGAFAEALAAPIEVRGGPPAGTAREERMRAHGRLSAEAQRGARREALRDVVRPCAQALLACGGDSKDAGEKLERALA